MHDSWLSEQQKSSNTPLFTWVLLVYLIYSYKLWPLAGWTSCTWTSVWETGELHHIQTLRNIFCKWERTTLCSFPNEELHSWRKGPANLVWVLRKSFISANRKHDKAPNKGFFCHSAEGYNCILLWQLFFDNLYKREKDKCKKNILFGSTS